MNPYRTRRDMAFFLAKIVLATLLVAALGSYARVADYLTLTFVTLLCLSPTTLGGLRVGIQQLLIALFSSFLTMGVLAALGDGLPAVALSLAAVAAVVIRLRQESLLAIAYFSTLYIAFYRPAGQTPAVFERVEHLLLGIPLAAALNLLFGMLSYRRRLLAGLRALRRDLFQKTGDILEAVLSASMPALERELRATEGQYARAAEIVHMLEDIEREQRSPLAPCFGSLPPARDYKLYVWNMRDLLQNAHAAAVLCFKMKTDDAAVRDLLVTLLQTIRRGVDEPAAAPSVALPAPRAAADPMQAAFHGNLTSMVIHLQAIRGFEEEMPELTGIGPTR